MTPPPAAAASLDAHFLDSMRHILRASKKLGDGALAQLDAEQMAREPAPGVNSVAVIVQHMRGNMLSRWTDFLASDGEKPWRQRDAEFQQPDAPSREEILALWEEGWACVFRALDALKPEDLGRKVTIRGQEHTVVQAILRQIDHYGYHVGQIVLLARLFLGDGWKTLSIARGQSQAYTPKGLGGEPKS